MANYEHVEFKHETLIVKVTAMKTNFRTETQLMSEICDVCGETDSNNEL